MNVPSWEMTPRQRELTLQMIDGFPDTGLMVSLFQISRHRRAEEIFEWLVRNNIRGPAFLAYLKERHSDSILNLMAGVIKAIDKDVVKRPIFAGKHYV